jgi:outer membrane protein OmpA-like peptidoglycan-associated protein
MRFSWRAAMMLILALFLVSASFADEKKTDKKSDDSSASTSDGSAVQPAKDAPAPTSQGASGGVTPASKPPAKSDAAMARDAGDEASESPKWVPMPAWNGNPGLFTLETGDTLPKGAFDFTAGVNKFSRMPGDITVLQVGPAFGVGVNRWLSLFVQIDADEHIHVGVPSNLSLASPNGIQFQNTIYDPLIPVFPPVPGVNPAYVEDFPFASHNGGGIGEIDLGFKIGLLSEKRGNPISLSVRNDFYIPTKTSLNDLLSNEVQSGVFNYGIGFEASKHVMHNSILATFNWGYRFTGSNSFLIPAGDGGVTGVVVNPNPTTMIPNGTPPPTTTRAVLNTSDQMTVGAGLLIFPQKRFQVITEYNGLIFVRRGIPDTSFGARDPVDSIEGVRLYLMKNVAIDAGYRYSLSLSQHIDRNGFIAKLGIGFRREEREAPKEDIVTSSCSVDTPSVSAVAPAIVQANASATDTNGYPLSYSWSATGGKIEGNGPYARWDSTGAAPGTQKLTVRVDNGRGGTSSCSMAVNVERPPNHPPTISCSTDRTPIVQGESTGITADASDPDNDPLTYSYSATSGRIAGSGAKVQFDSTGLPAGTYAVKCSVDDGRGGTADASTNVVVQAPAEVHELEVKLALHSIYFPTAQPTAAKPEGGLVDSQQQILASLATDFVRYLSFKPDAHLILGGHADNRGSVDYNKALSERRVERAKSFLVEHGVPAGSIEVRAFGKEDELSADQVKEQLQDDPDLSPEERKKTLDNLAVIVLANNRRVDVTLSTTGQQSVRRYPFNSKDALALISTKGGEKEPHAVKKQKKQ